MPYIAIKGFPAYDETVREVAERIERGEITRDKDKMLTLGGKYAQRKNNDLHGQQGALRGAPRRRQR